MEINKNLINRLTSSNIKSIKNLEISKLINENKTENNTSNINLEDNTLTNINNILSSIGIKFESTEQALTLVNNLLINQLPITKENLQVLNQSLKLFEDKEIEKGIFILKNELKPTQSLSTQLDMYINKEIKISSQILDVLSKISKTENTEEILETLTSSKELVIEFNELKNELNTFINKEDINKLKNEVILTSSENIDKNTKNDTNKTSLNISEATNSKFENFINKLTSSEILFENSNFITEFAEILKDDSNIEILISELNKKISLENNKNNFDITNKDTLNKDIISKDILNKEENIENNKSPLIFKDIINKFKNEENILKEFLGLLQKNKVLKEETIQTFEKINNFNAKIKENISFKVENSSVEDLNEFFEKLQTKLELLKNNITNNNFVDKDNSEILNSITNINKNIDFMSYMKNNIYIQIPLNINNENKTAELYVFKDRKNAKSSKSKNGSALIALDLSNLGHIETFINKTEEKISLQFRVTNKLTENLIKENLNLLEEYLSEKKLTISSVQFKELKDKFSIISDIKKTNEPINISSFNTQA